MKSLIWAAWLLMDFVDSSIVAGKLANEIVFAAKVVDGIYFQVYYDY